MKDVSSMLRRLDEEITGHKQRIAFSQVEIARLQDTRQVLMRLAEDDQHAEEQNKLERLRIINGAHAKPELIVRRTGTGEEEAKPKKKDAPDDKKAAEKRAKDAERHRLKRLAKGSRPKPSGEGASGQMREAVLRVVDAETPMNSREIALHLGIKGNDQLLYNALYQLRKSGLLTRGEDKRYLRPS
jgi:hypothetical protein